MVDEPKLEGWGMDGQRTENKEGPNHVLPTHGPEPSTGEGLK